jgi:putative zinc ribbon protein
MDIKNFCQSCSKPLDDPELLGSEKDNSPNREYCKYCYLNGSFVHPGMTLEQMKSQIIDRMDKESIPADIIETTVNRLPFLKRWKSTLIDKT